MSTELITDDDFLDDAPEASASPSPSPAPTPEAKEVITDDDFIDDSDFVEASPVEPEVGTAETIGRAAQVGFGTRLQPALSGYTEAAAGVFDAALPGSNAFGDESSLDALLNFKENYQRAKATHEQQIAEVEKANPGKFMAIEIVTSIPRTVAAVSGLSALGATPLTTNAALGGFEGFARSKSSSTMGVAVDTATAAGTNILLGGAFDLVGKGLKGVNPVDSALSAVGKMAGPAAQAAAAKAIGDSTLKSATNGAASLTTLAVGGGAVDILISQPKTWDDTVESFKRGATIAAGLGLAKSVGSGLFKWGGNIIAKAQFKNKLRDIEAAEGQLGNTKRELALKERTLANIGQEQDAAISAKLAQRDAALTDLQLKDQADELLQSEIQTKQSLKQSELGTVKTQADIQDKKLQQLVKQTAQADEEIAQTQSLLETIQSQKAKYEAVLAQDRTIGERMATLPNQIDNTLKEVLEGPEGFGAQIASKVMSLDPSKRVQFRDLLDETYKAIDNTQTSTGDAAGAKQSARRVIEMFEDSTAKTKSAVDPITNKKVGMDTSSMSPQELWTAKQQIQDLLYSKDFLAASKGTPLRKTLVKFENKIRERLNDLDGSGELAKLNDAYSNMLQARLAFQDAPEKFFERLALKETDPSVIRHQMELEKHFMDSASLKQGGFKGGLKPETASDPIIGNRIKALKGAIDAKASVDMSDFATLQEAKKAFKPLENQLVSTEAKLAKAVERRSLADLKLQETKFQRDQLGAQVKQVENEVQATKKLGELTKQKSKFNADKAASNLTRIAKEIEDLKQAKSVNMERASLDVDKVKETIRRAENALEDMKRMDIDIPTTGPLRQKIEFLKQVLSEAKEDPKVKTALKGGKGLKQVTEKAIAPQTAGNLGNFFR